MGTDTVYFKQGIPTGDGGGYSRDRGDWGDIYYSPDKVGMEAFADVDVLYEAYEFHLLAVWKAVLTGDLYAAADTGCSCPTPFEELGSLAELAAINDVADLDPLLTYLSGTSYRFEESGNSQGIEQLRGKVASYLIDRARPNRPA
jgi:hypothetical protein